MPQRRRTSTSGRSENGGNQEGATGCVFHHVRVATAWFVNRFGEAEGASSRRRTVGLPVRCFMECTVGREEVTGMEDAICRAYYTTKEDHTDG